MSVSGYLMGNRAPLSRSVANWRGRSTKRLYGFASYEGSPTNSSAAASAAPWVMCRSGSTSAIPAQRPSDYETDVASFGGPSDFDPGDPAETGRADSFLVWYPQAVPTRSSRPATEGQMRSDTARSSGLGPMGGAGLEPATSCL